MTSIPTKIHFQDCTHPSLSNPRDTVIVYRVEDSDGYGYKRSLDREIGNVTFIDWNGYDERRPLPKSDGIDIDSLSEDWFFGFGSVDALKNWFLLNERNAGAKLGGQIVLIEADSDFVIHGGRQVVFHQKYSKTVASVAMNHYDSDEDRARPFEDYDEDA